MKKIKWIFAGLILLLSVNGVVATTTVYSGSFNMPCHHGDASFSNLSYSTPTISGTFYYTYHISYFFHGADCSWCLSRCDSGYLGTDVYINPGGILDCSVEQTDVSGTAHSSSSNSDTILKAGFNPGYDGYSTDTSFCLADGYATFVVSTEAPNHVFGDTQCVDRIILYIKNGAEWVECDNTSLQSYSFEIYNGASYRLSFDGKFHDFICDGTDISYDYDACAYCTINIQDECANLLHNQFTWIDDGGTIIYEGRDNPIKIQRIGENDKLTVMWNTWLGALQKTCYAQFDYPINLYDPFVYWDMEVYVYDNKSNPIDHANVDFNQDCVINGYPIRNKFTNSGGMASFTQCENDNANLVVSKDGYKTLSTSISGGWYDAYTPTYQVSVTLQSTGSDNSSTWDLINNSINDTNATEIPDDIPDVNGTPYDIHIYFRNMNGDYTNQINDTDDYVRCYYSVHTPDDVNMTLVFQKSFTGYYFYEVDTYSYLIDNNSYGYFNIPNSYFNDSDYSYRAYIYDYAYPYDDRYAYLNVVNQTEPYYNNLTGYCMFMNTNRNGSIDYREDIVCYAYVESDNNSLENVSLELYDNSTLIEYKNLTYSDFDDDNIYGWYLGYNYTLGHNYSLVLRGYDGSILDCDNVIAKNIIGNKLTVKVTDSFNHPLSNVYVFCEHYGSINTGYLNYGTFEGLPDGEIRYKASKTGYRSGLWSTVNLTSENEIVNYQLIQEIQEGSISQARMTDDDVKNLYYPLMYFLLTLILLGALINVIK